MYVGISMSQDREQIEDIKAKIDIVDYIGIVFGQVDVMHLPVRLARFLD